MWLAPVQVKLLPISDRFMDYTQSILQKLKKADIRAEVDDRSEKIGKKIRDTELARIPYMLIIGEKEMESGTVSLRRQGRGDLGSKAVDEFIRSAQEEIKSRSAE